MLGICALRRLLIHDAREDPAVFVLAVGAFAREVGEGRSRGERCFGVPLILQAARGGLGLGLVRAVCEHEGMRRAGEVPRVVPEWAAPSLHEEAPHRIEEHQLDREMPKAIAGMAATSRIDAQDPPLVIA